MYIENPDEEQNQNQSSSSPAIGAGGGGAAVGTGGNPSTVSPVQINQPNQSFANVQDYLKSNQQQGEDFGNKFISTIGQGVNQAKSVIDTSAQNAQNQITTGTVNTNQNLLNQAKTTPTVITNDADKLAEFQKEYNAQYTGPSSFESSDQYTNAANSANQAVQTGQELGTTGGREQLLQDTFGVYGQGNKGLDQALLQNSSAYSNVAPLAQSFQSVQDYLNSAAANTNAAAQNAAKTTEATKTAATGALANNVSNFQNQLNTEVANKQQSAKDAQEAIQKDLQTGNVQKFIDDLVSTGMPLNDVVRIENYLNKFNAKLSPNLDLSNYYTNNPLTDINTNNVATPEEYANAEAYKTLTGTDYGGVLNPANTGQANTASITPKFDSSRLLEYLKNFKT